MHRMNRFLTELNARGDFLDHMQDDMKELVHAVMESGKKGTVTLTIEVTKNSDETVVARAEVKSRIPQKRKPQTTFYVTGDKQLVRNDPNQQKLDVGNESGVPSGVASGGGLA